MAGESKEDCISNAKVEKMIKILALSFLTHCLPEPYLNRIKRRMRRVHRNALLYALDQHRVLGRLADEAVDLGKEGRVVGDDKLRLLLQRLLEDGLGEVDRQRDVGNGTMARGLEQETHIVPAPAKARISTGNFIDQAHHAQRTLPDGEGLSFSLRSLPRSKKARQLYSFFGKFTNEKKK